MTSVAGKGFARGGLHLRDLRLNHGRLEVGRFGFVKDPGRIGAADMGQVQQLGGQSVWTFKGCTGCMGDVADRELAERQEFHN